MKDAIKPWIERGYKVFAYGGPQDIKIEALSKDVGKNKSSFYHHFADMEVFVTLLLEEHLRQNYLIAEKEAKCENLEELIEVIVEHKVDLLFSRQLRIHRENEEFAKCFQKSNEITAEAIAGVWAASLGLTDQSYLAGLVLKLSLENFFLQITDETLNKEWLQNYFNEIKALISAFKSGTPIPKLDGSV